MSKVVFNKKVAMLLIQIIVVAVALVLAVGTYTWYTAQSTVEVTETMITAAAGANTTLLDVTEETNPRPYSGQTGKGFPDDNPMDVPYTRTVTVKVTFEPTQADPCLVIKLNSMVVRLSDGVTIYDSESDPKILEQFTWRAYACTLTGDPESPTRSDEVELFPETEVRTFSHLEGEETVEENVVVKTGYALYVPDPDDPEVTQRYPVFEDTVTEIRIELIFLDESSYLARLDYEEYLAGNNEANINRYNDIELFRYCGYENMRAVFSCGIEIGFDY